MKKPTQWLTIKQPEGSRLCTACVAAMAVAKPLEYATERMTPTFHEGDGKPYYRMRELFKFLGDHTISYGIQFTPAADEFMRPSDFDGPLEVEFDVVGMPALVAVTSEVFVNAAHYVFWDGTGFRDSSYKVKEEVVPLSESTYEILEWAPLTYFDDGSGA